MSSFQLAYRPVHAVGVHQVQAPGAEPIFWPICTCKWNDQPAINHPAPAVTFTDEQSATLAGEAHLRNNPVDLGHLLVRREWWGG